MSYKYQVMLIRQQNRRGYNGARQAVDRVGETRHAYKISVGNLLRKHEEEICRIALILRGMLLGSGNGTPSYVMFICLVTFLRIWRP
jgi:hypothetical protein